TSWARSRIVKSRKPAFSSAIAVAMPPKPQPMTRIGTLVRLAATAAGVCVTCTFMLASMRFVPIVGGAGVDVQGHAELHRRMRRVLHHPRHHRQRGCNLLVRHLED